MKLKQGDKAPNFTLVNQDGMEVSLSDFIGKKVILYFYPKDNTSGCTLEAQDFSALMEEFLSLDACIVGVSPDSIQSHQKFIASKNLKIMLLSDETKAVSQSYGAYGEKLMYGKKVYGMIRSTFVIDEKGELIGVFYNVRAKGHAQKVLDILRK